MGSLLDPVRDLIESGPLAHLVTVNGDGSPQVTIVWIGIEDEEIVSGHLFEPRKVRNILRDPRVAIPLESSGVECRRNARLRCPLRPRLVTEGGAPELLHRLAQIYVGPGAMFPPMPDPPPGYVTRIEVGRIAGQGPWVSRE
jgi:pyridoxamine 5'-phosphate oxidase-like protein